MDTHVTEAGYPLSFREDTAKTLGEHLQHQHSVELVGLKRVGINNFIRFFLFHDDIKKQYMPQDGHHFFILVDLNDLIEREIFPFWRLAFKRIVDAVEASTLDDSIKTKISNLFVASIQTGDLFLTYDGVREALSLLVKENIYPTLFFTRFDRLRGAVTQEFFNNLRALKDATNGKLSYVFTSYRELDTLVPAVFQRKNLSLFSNVLYVTPMPAKDSRIYIESYIKKYDLSLKEDIIKEIIFNAGGHVQYLQLSLVIINELYKKDMYPDGTDLVETILVDERTTLQSEELWDNFTDEEKAVLMKVLHGKKITQEEKERAIYLWNTGCLVDVKGKTKVFSPLFTAFLAEQDRKAKDTSGVEFSKKEHMLFSLLQTKVNDICEREEIVEFVWPEYKEYGVSDWSVDRLVARVRSKLKKQKGKYEIVTVRTRGYKLLEK